MIKSQVYRSLIEGHEGEASEDEKKQVDEFEKIQIIYNHSKRILISDSGDKETYSSSFSLKNISDQPITLDLLQITTGEQEPQPIVDTQLQVPDTSQWSDFIKFENLGKLDPGEETKEYKFTYSIVRAIAGPELPEEYINKIYFYPSYTVNSKHQPQLVYDITVVKAQDQE